jgi:hemoglobin/transferrin/lactoferrin receptor protein
MKYALLLVLCFQQLYAQQVIIIKDKATSIPISGAQLTVEWVDANTQKKNININRTNDKGEVLFTEDHIRNNATIQIVKAGYQNTSLTTFKLIEQHYIVLLTPSVITIDEVVVSANKFEEPKKDVPRQIETITQKEVQFSNPQTSADMLQNSGHVFIQRSQMGGGSPVIRGFEANKVLIVIDGVRMNNAIYRGGHLQNVLRIDPNMLSQTEVFFGPGSVIYGSDAMGGVMHFTTLQPKLGKQNQTLIRSNAFTRYSSVNNEVTAHYDINLGFTKWAFITSVNASIFRDLLQGANRPASMGTLGIRDSIAKRINGKDTIVANNNKLLQSPSGYQQIDIMQKILFMQSPQVKHLLNLQFSNTSDVPRYDRLTDIDVKTGRLALSEWYYGPELRSLASYQLQLSKPRRLYNEARITAAYQYIEESRHTRNFAAPNRSSRNEYVHVYSLNADLTKQLKKNEIRYGVELTMNNIRSNASRLNLNTNEITSQSTRYPDGGSSMRTIAAYVSHSWEISDKLILSDGLRLSYVQLNANFINKSFFSFLPDQIQQQNLAANGHLGITYLPTQSIKLFGTLSSAFRAPNIDDLAKSFESDFQRRLAIIPNPDLKPEYAYTAEFGISTTVRKRIKFEITGFYTLVTNLITTQKIQVNGSDSILFNGIQSRATQNQNIQQAYVTGLSALLSADITKNILIVNTFNYTYGRIITDSTPYPLDHIAPAFGRSAIHITVNRFRTECFVLYHSWKRIKNYNLVGEDNPQYATPQGIPGWYTFNIRLAYTLPLANEKQFVFQVGCENLLDRTYRTFASGINGPGRNLYLAVRASF